MGRKSIRFRLTIWYSLALAGSLALFASAIWISMWQMLQRDVDRSLSEHMKSVQSFIREELKDPSVHLAEELAEYSHALPDDTYMQVQSQQGRPVFSSPADFPWHSIDPLVKGQTRFEWRNHPYQVLSQSLPMRDGLWRVTFAVSLSENAAVLRRLLILLLTLGPAVVLVAVLGGRWLSRRALRPVDEITEVARQIGIQNLSGRLAVPQTGDELQRLSETWNSMLSRLENAVNRLSRFTADASHELRTPLAVIRSTAEIASRRSRPAEVYRAALEEVVAESERMTVLIDDLLFLARCDAEGLDLPMEMLPLNGIVDEVYSLMRPIADVKGLELVLADDAPASIVGNQSAIRRLILVLVDNAVKYSEPGGIVTLAVSTSGDQVHLKIRDQGPGIPESELPFLFQRFYRGFSAREKGKSGSGLGLALASGIAQHHNSTINVNSSAGKGSVFEVIFPAARAGHTSVERDGNGASGD